MTYRFTSKAAADLLLLDDSGDTVLLAMGQTPRPQGILQPAAMQAAINALHDAVAREEGAQGALDADAVSLRQRAWPMLEMMRHCLAAQEPIVWGT